MPRKTKFAIDTKKLEEYIILHGAPPKNASIRRADGYWATACKYILGRTVTNRFVKAVAARYYSNLDNIRDKTEEQLQSSPSKENTNKENAEDLEEMVTSYSSSPVHQPDQHEDMYTRSSEQITTVEEIGGVRSPLRNIGENSPDFSASGNTQITASQNLESHSIVCTETFCVCKKEYDMNKFMLMCDYCLDYFHPDCIELTITEEEAKLLSEFKCPKCLNEKRVSPLYHSTPDAKMARYSESKQSVTMTSSSATWINQQLENTPSKLERLSLPATMKEVQITSNEWLEIGDGSSGKLKTEWTEVVAAKLKSVNPFCSAAFKKGYLRKGSSRKEMSPLFRCEGYCTFATCNFKFRIAVRSDNASGILLMTITSSGDIVHDKQERRSRNIRGKQRQDLQKRLTFESPSTVFCKQYMQITKDQLVSGNRDAIGRTASPYKKISSEGRKSLQKDPDLITSLVLLRNEIRLEGSDSLGYIQRIQAVPFSVHCFTEMGVRIYHNICRKNALYCDATGTITTLPSSTLLYYSLVVQHPSSGSPVAVAEMVSSEHSITAVSFFLDNFRREEGIIFGFKNVIIPKKIVIDRSQVLLQSFLRIFNMENLSFYLHRCFRIINGTAKEDDFKKTTVLACVSHVMNSAKRMCSKLFSDKDSYRFSMYVFSVLVNAHSLTKFVKCLKFCKIVFCSKHIHKCVKDASVALVGMFNELGIDETEERIETFDGGDEEIEIIDCNSDDEGKGTNKKPFGPYFEKHLSRTVISSSKAEKNPLYQPCFIETLQKNWLPMAPFWSGMLRGDLQRYKNWSEAQDLPDTEKNIITGEIKNERTSGAIEAWNLILKRVDHKKHRSRPDVFIRQHWEVLFGRQIRFIDTLKAAKKRQLSKQLNKGGKELKEKWSRRNRVNRIKRTSYQNPPKKLMKIEGLVEETMSISEDVEVIKVSKASRPNAHQFDKPSVDEIVCKVQPNLGLKNNHSLLCWLNSSVQLLKASSLPLWLSVLPSNELSSVQWLFTTILEELDSNQRADASVLASCLLEIVDHTGGDPSEGLLFLVEALSESFRTESLFGLDFHRSGYCKYCLITAVEENVTHKFIFVSQQCNDGEQSLTSLIRNQLVSLRDFEIEQKKCSNCSRILIMDCSVMHKPENLIVCMPRVDHEIGFINNRICIEMELSGIKFNDEMKYRLQAIILYHPITSHYTVIVWNGYGWTDYSDDAVTEREPDYNNSDFVMERSVVALYCAKEHAKAIMSKSTDATSYYTMDNNPLFGDKTSFSEIVESVDNEQFEVFEKQWLSSQMVSEYFELLVDTSEQLFAFGTVLLPKLKATGYQGVYRYAKKANVFRKKWIFFPIHLTAHWILVAVNIPEKSMYYIDSLNEFAPSSLNWIWYFLNKESVSKLGHHLNRTEWKYINSNVIDVPKQSNTYDCGILMCMAAKCLTFQNQLLYSNMDAKLGRKVFLFELKEKKIIPPGNAEFSRKLCLENPVQYEIGNINSQPCNLHSHVVNYIFKMKEKQVSGKYLVHQLEEEELYSWMRTKKAKSSSYIKIDPDCYENTVCVIDKREALLLMVANVEKQCVVSVSSDSATWANEIEAFRKLNGIHHSIFNKMGRKYSHWSKVDMAMTHNHDLFILKYLYLLLMEGNFTVDAHIIHNCNKGIDYFLNSEDEIAEAGMSTDEETDLDQYLQKYEKDPIGSGLLVPSMENMNENGYDTDEELFSRPALRGKRGFLNYYPLLDRPCESEDILFTRNFIRREVKNMEITLRQLHSQKLQSRFENAETRSVLKKLLVHIRLWPLELDDMMDEVNYYLKGLQADVSGDMHIPVRLSDFSTFIIIPEVLTRLIMKRFNYNYDEAVNAFFKRNLPQRSSERQSVVAAVRNEIQSTTTNLQKTIVEGDETGLQIVPYIQNKGRGVVARKGFKEGEYVCEYSGKLLSHEEGTKKECEYEVQSLGCYLYFFSYKGRKLCIDATKETGLVGRLINHSRNQPNLIPKVIEIEGEPHIYFIAKRHIKENEEILYDYGDRRRRIVEENSWLAK